MNGNSSETREPLRVAISGASGLIGRRLTQYVSELGMRTIRLVRGAATGMGEVRWEPATGRFEAEALAGVDGVVHLAGENIAGGRWNAARMKAIRESRVGGTALLCAGLAGLARPPKVLIAASAIGYYGDRGDEELTEESVAGSGFLADVSQEWEAATEPARAAGVRVVNLRTGVVLAREGGALARMLPPFGWGVGGVVGSGRQYMSWITLHDLVRAVAHLLSDEDVSGPVNAVGPEPVTNAGFVRTLGRVLGRPTVLPLPAAVVGLLFGRMGRELLLGSARVVPKRLLASGFTFVHAQLEPALRAELGRDVQQG